MSERDHAIMEAHKITASDEYFAARPQLDCNDRRKVYEAGFQCAWTEAQAESAAEIADLRRQLEDARKDADRYAYLRNENRRRALALNGPEAGVWCDCEDAYENLVLLTGADLDAAIDAAMTNEG